MKNGPSFVTAFVGQLSIWDLMLWIINKVLKGDLFAQVNLIDYSDARMLFVTDE
jgi:hypothetical protein